MKWMIQFYIIFIDKSCEEILNKVTNWADVEVVANHFQKRPKIKHMENIVYKSMLHFI